MYLPEDGPGRTRIAPLACRQSAVTRVHVRNPCSCGGGGDLGSKFLPDPHCSPFSLGGDIPAPTRLCGLRPSKSLPRCHTPPSPPAPESYFPSSAHGADIHLLYPLPHRDASTKRPAGRRRILVHCLRRSRPRSILRATSTPDERDQSGKRFHTAPIRPCLNRAMLVIPRALSSPRHIAEMLPSHLQTRRPTRP